MTDRIHTDALKRAEAAERAISRMREQAWGHRVLIVLWALSAVSCCVFGCLTGYQRNRAESQRDAAQSQAQLYLDGLRECKREAEAVKPMFGEPTYRWPAGTCSCLRATGALKYFRACYDGDGSMLDPVRRIDR